MSRRSWVYEVDSPLASQIMIIQTDTPKHAVKDGFKSIGVRLFRIKPVSQEESNVKVTCIGVPNGVSYFYVV